MPINRRDAKPVKGVPGIMVAKNSDPNGPDRYIVRICYRDPKTGRKVDREGVVVGVLADALALRDKLHRQGAQRSATSRERCRDFVDRWASDHLKTVEPSTRARYINAIAHLNRGFGDFFVDAFEPKDLKLWFHEQQAEYSAVTINGWITVMRLALDEAVSAGTLATNPARKTKALTTGATKGRRSVALSPKQFRDFISAIDSLRTEEIITLDAAAMILTLAWTGARMGEARALRWEDWHEGELHIERALWRHHLKVTKNKDPRAVHVVDPLAEVLNAHRRYLVESQHEGLESGLMFPCSAASARCSSTRRNVDELVWFKSGSCLTEPLLRVCKRAAVPEMSPHALRRTWEKMMRKADVDGMVRRSIAGWRTETAQAIYSDVDADDRAAAGVGPDHEKAGPEG